jgi:O-antigen/teichoic acid export membrane protein
MVSKFLALFGGDGYQARAIRGSAAVVTRMVGENVIRLGGNLILTRILFPEAFGLMALVTVVLVAVSSFSDVGINPAILQSKRGHDPVFLNTAWTVQIGRGVVLCIAILVLAAPIAAFYEAPQLADLLTVAAIVPMVQGFNSTKLATARREIQLERLVVLETGSQLVGTMAMIALSLWLESVWGLMLGTLVGPISIAVLSHVMMKGEPNRLAFESEAFRSILGFGKYVFFATIAGFFVHQGDRTILGKYVSLDDLAIYNIGFFLASVPALLATTLSWNVIYPLYARRPPADSPANRRKINLARRLFTFSVLLAMAFLALIGDWLIRFLYDMRYEAAGPILILVALGGMPSAIIQTYDTLPLANGHSGRFAFFTIARAAVLISCLLLAVPHYGLWGAALAPTVTAILIYPLLIWVVAPYNSWDPIHDILFVALTVTLLTAVVWVHADTLIEALPR